MIYDLLLLFVAMAVPAPGVMHHPIEHIINVQWDEGLAVEFFEKAT